MKKEYTKAFQSSLGDKFIAFVEFKRSLGRKYPKVEGILRKLDRFLARHYPETTELSLAVLEHWLAEESYMSPLTTRHQLGFIRQFCLYHRRFHPSVFVPDKRNASSIWPHNVPRFLPHIYSKEEIRKLLRTAQQLRITRKSPHRARTSYIVLLLLYATGMRISEVAALRISDIDWTEGTLLIRETKFKKSRLIPLNEEVIDCLKEYKQCIPRTLFLSPKKTPLFQKGHGQGYTLRGIECNLRKILEISGVARPGCRKPRIHDLRHTFAVHRLVDWYQTGADVQNLLPRLATYMGHTCLVSTQYYLTVTPEIYEKASQKFEEFYQLHQRRA